MEAADRLLRYADKKIINADPSEYTGQGLVTFTYDDGLMNQYDNALPLHEKYQIPATFYVIAGRLEGFPDFFNVEHVKDCVRRGVEIGAHSYNHDINFTDKTDAMVHFECYETNRLFDMAAPKVNTMAVPFSAHDQRVRDIVGRYYDAYRVGSPLQQNSISSPKPLYYTEQGTSGSVFDDFKIAIDTAVTNGTWCIVGLHGVVKDNEPKGSLEINESLLEETLQYVASFDRNQLLPITTKDALLLS